MSEHTAGNPGVDEERGHTFDGITEFDNRLPNWWLWTFYLACIFSVIYWLVYHVASFAPLPHAAFEREMADVAAAEESSSVLTEVTDDALRALAQDEKAVARGANVFAANCIACHMTTAAGSPESVGPNLTDKFWIHGGKPTDIHKTITEGVIEKGMLAWEPILGAAKVQQVTAFLLTLRNTDVEGGKPPEGEPYDGQ